MARKSAEEKKRPPSVPKRHWISKNMYTRPQYGAQYGAQKALVTYALLDHLDHWAKLSEVYDTAQTLFVPAEGQREKLDRNCVNRQLNFMFDNGEVSKEKFNGVNYWLYGGKRATVRQVLKHNIQNSMCANDVYNATQELCEKEPNQWDAVSFEDVRQQLGFLTKTRTGETVAEVYKHVNTKDDILMTFFQYNVSYRDYVTMTTKLQDCESESICAAAQANNRHPEPLILEVSCEEGYGKIKVESLLDMLTPNCTTNLDCLVRDMRPTSSKNAKKSKMSPPKSKDEHKEGEGGGELNISFGTTPQVFSPKLGISKSPQMFRPTKLAEKLVSTECNFIIRNI